jgi:O-antigen ligase
MKDDAANKYIGMYLLVTVTAVTLLVTPFNSVDPINLPKLCLLIFLAFTSLGLVISKKAFLQDNRFRLPMFVMGAFILQLVLVLILDNREFSLKFYGTPSRNTGFIAYISLSILLIVSMASAGYLLIRRYVWALVFVGATLAVYGYIQNTGHDFYQFSNYGSNVFGSFGNPNFHSAFMGIAGAVGLTLAVFSSLKIPYKVGLTAIVGLAVFNVSVSSQQGYLNFMAGFMAAVVVYLFKKRHVAFGWSFLGLFGIGIFLVLFGVLDKGPLAEFIYKFSLQARGFYWRGAIKMMSDHPFFGVGMDGFGDWYRRSRSPEVAKFNSGLIADTAHNIPLDIGSSGGFPLLALYLAILGLALYSITKVIKRKSEFDVYFAAIVAAWVAYQAQSLISINQLGLGVWGWSLTGLLIGYEINTRNSTLVENQKNPQKGKGVSEKLSAGALVITFFSLGIGLAIALPPYIAADRFYKALQSGDANIIQPAAYLQPFDSSRFLFVAQILQENKFEDRAVTVLRDASKIYPDLFQIWNNWAGITSASPIDIARAKAEMKRLDPFNPDLK